MSEAVVENKEVTTESTQAQSEQPRREFVKNKSKVRPRKQRDNKKEPKEKSEFDEKIINIRRVSRMFKGGRRMRLSVFIVIGDRKGRVGLGIGKGQDVRSAQQKAVNNAKKNLVAINLNGNTIPHQVAFKKGASKIFLKPAAPGTGIVAGSSVRLVAEVAGIKDILGKILGKSNNKINNAYAAVEALKSLRSTRL